MTNDSSSTKQTDTDLAKVRFDLSDLYSGVHDPRIAQDLAEYAQRTVAIKTNFRGRLAEIPNSGCSSNLGKAIKDLDEAEKLANKVWCFVLLSYSCNQADDMVKALKSKVDESFAQCAADNLTFMEIEICKIEAAGLTKLLELDETVRFYHPYIEQVRRQRPHQLSEDVERALTLRTPYGPTAVCDFLEEQIAGLNIIVPAGVEHEIPKPLTLEQALSKLASPDRSLRAASLKAINDTLGEKIVSLSVLALNLVVGSKGIEDRERSYTSPMQARNLANQISSKVVEALHSAVKRKGAEVARRFYSLLAKQLKAPRLAWSDRNAPVRTSEQRVTWKEAVEIVLAGYRSFSPSLADLIEQMLVNGRIDAPTYPNKQNGAFSLSVVLPEPAGSRSYNLLNFTGTLRDVAVFAHEAGHAVHGVLAGRVQGALMSRPPTAYAETASVFGEMITYEGILRRATSNQERLAILMSKLGDFMNTVVRQICFSTFEQQLHAERAAAVLSAERICTIWRETTAAFYGPDGETFDYRDMDNTWSYIGHFHRPFYVYSYAFGELLTQSLYAERETLGDRFEPLYLDMLRAGATKDAIELLKPFGLNPEDSSFWERGIAASAERWLKLAEELAAESGLNE